MIRALGLVGCVALAALVERLTDAPSAMRAAAREFAASLSAEQRAKAGFALDDAERLDWHYVPRERRGLPLAEMTSAQRELAAKLLQASLSERGARQVEDVRVLEGVLREREGPGRDPDKYFVTLFGDVGGEGPWGWRYEGHHVSLNFTSPDDARFSATPSFVGANPARVEDGAHAGLRLLGAEEDLAYELLASLDERQRARAVLSGAPPGDIALIPGREDNVEALGLALADLDEGQRSKFWRLVDQHVGRLDAALADAERRRIRALAPQDLLFAWIGSPKPGEPHYYRIRGPRFALELDNGREGANHAHAVWRDLDRDFGRDLLREHLEGDHGKR